MTNPAIVWHPYMDAVTKEMAQVPVDVDMLIDQFKQTKQYIHHSYDKSTLAGSLFELHLAHLLTTLKKAVPSVDLDPVLKGEVAWHSDYYRFLRDGHTPMGIYSYKKIKIRGKIQHQALCEYDAVIRLPVSDQKWLTVVWEAKMISYFTQFSNDFDRSLRKMTTIGLDVLKHRLSTNQFACILLLPNDLLYTNSLFIDGFIAKGGKVITAPVSYRDYMNAVREKSVEYGLFQ